MSSRRPLRPILERAAIAVVCSLLAGCASSTGIRVAVDKDATDVVFGGSTTTTTAAPALPPPGVVGPTAGVVLEPVEEVVTEVTTTVPTVRVTQPSRPPATACDTASPTAPVERAASATVQGRPEPGSYRWLASGTYLLEGVKIPLLTPFTHLVRAVEDATDPSPHVIGAGPSEVFRYQSLDPRIGGGFTAFSWQVKADSADPGDAEAGLVLRQVDIVNTTNAVQSTYFRASTNGLLFFPLTVKPGQTWTSTSIDPTRGAIVVQGEVLGRKTSDACGTVVEGWQTRLTVRDGPAVATIDMLVAPQYGAQIIAFDVAGTFLGVEYSDAKMRIGHLEPAPLPSAFA